MTTVSPLPYLRHLAIDNHVDSVAGRYRSSWSTFIALTQSWNCSLTSIVLKPSIRATLPDSVVTALMKAHETTIQHMVLLNCEVTMGSLWSITSRCTSLERLGVAIPHKDIVSIDSSSSPVASVYCCISILSPKLSHSRPLSILSKTSVIPHVSKQVELPSQRTTSDCLWTLYPLYKKLLLKIVSGRYVRDSFFSGCIRSL